MLTENTVPMLESVSFRALPRYIHKLLHRFLLSDALVAALPILGGPELVHLSHTLLELLVLALLVGVALVLLPSVSELQGLI